MKQTTETVGGYMYKTFHNNKTKYLVSIEKKPTIVEAIEERQENGKMFLIKFMLHGQIRIAKPILGKWTLITNKL